MTKNIERVTLKTKIKRKQQVNSKTYLEKDPILIGIWNNKKDTMYDKM